jgi:signal transduction histidine kinase/tetratricopeptide (TPR) repeat protein
MKKFLLLIFSLLIFSQFATSQPSADSLLQLCSKATEKQKTDLYLKLSITTRSDSARSNLYARIAYNLAIKNKQLPEQAKSLYYLGEINYKYRNFDKAISNYKSAIPLYELAKDTFFLSNCYTSVGLCYNNIDQGDKAIIQYIEGLKLCIKNQEYTAEILHNIGNVHKKMRNFYEAINYYQKAKAINLMIKDSVSLAANYNGLADSFLEINKKDSAIVYFTKANTFFKKLKKIGYEAITLANLGTIYASYPDSLTKAYEAFNNAWAEFKKLGWNLYESEIKEGFGDILCAKGKYNDAIARYNESLQATEQYKRGFDFKKSTYQKMSKAYELKGDYKSALKYHVLYAQYSDSLNKKEKYDKLVSVEKQYESEKKENEIKQLEAKQQILDIQLQTNRQLKLFGFVTAALLLVLLFFTIIRYIDKAKSNHLLELKNIKIAESEHELRQINAAKNKFFSIIAHDLKNPLHSVMGYSYLLSKDFDRFSDDERRKFATDINQSTNNIFRLLQNLLEWSRSQTGRLVVIPQEIKLSRIVKNATNVLHPLAENKNIKIENQIDQELTVYADPQMIETVIRNLVSNAIKFTPENGLIEISARQTGELIEFCVKDSGIGISEEDAKNLFQIDSKVKRKGTNDEDGSGIGLILCKEFVDRNHGKIWVESTFPKGSSFFFTIPTKNNS